MNETQTDIGELIEPSQVGFSFDTPGWYVVGIVLLLTILLVLFLSWRNYRRNKYRRDALQYLSDLECKLSGCQLTYETNMLLKRIALRSGDRNEIAALRNEQWITFLNESGKSGLFSPESEKTLNDIYSDTHQANDFILNARTWIRIHKFSKKKIKPAMA